MDRFIELIWNFIKDIPQNLKSNMDRFIVRLSLPRLRREVNLKSNMDRFIARNIFDIIPEVQI